MAKDSEWFDLQLILKATSLTCNQQDKGGIPAVPCSFNKENIVLLITMSLKLGKRYSNSLVLMSALIRANPMRLTD